MNKKRELKQKGLFLRVLGSSAVTPLLGLLALASIIYYKRTYVPQQTKKKKDKKALSSFFLPQQKLGKVRENGPILTKSLFFQGDLIIVKKGKLLLPAMVEKKSKKILLWPPSQGSQELIPWLKKHGGRFALFHLPRGAKKKVKQLLSAAKVAARSKSKENILGFFLKLKEAGFPFTTNKPQPAFSALLEKSHYNDLK